MDSSVALQGLPVVGQLPDPRRGSVATGRASLVPDVVGPASAAPAPDMYAFTVMNCMLSWHCCSLLFWRRTHHYYVVATEHDVANLSHVEWIRYVLRALHV